MARHVYRPGAKHGGVDVRASGMMVIKKKVQKDLGEGILGLSQVRAMRNIVTDPRLLKINACMASKLAGKKPGTLEAAQSAFKEARAACKY